MDNFGEILFHPVLRGLCNSVVFLDVSLAGWWHERGENYWDFELILHQRRVFIDLCKPSKQCAQILIRGSNQLCETAMYTVSFKMWDSCHKIGQRRLWFLPGVVATVSHLIVSGLVSVPCSLRISISFIVLK